MYTSLLYFTYNVPIKVKKWVSKLIFQNSYQWDTSVTNQSSVHIAFHQLFLRNLFLFVFRSLLSVINIPYVSSVFNYLSNDVIITAFVKDGDQLMSQLKVDAFSRQVNRLIVFIMTWLNMSTDLNMWKEMVEKGVSFLLPTWRVDQQSRALLGNYLVQLIG